MRGRIDSQENLGHVSNSWATIIEEFYRYRYTLIFLVLLIFISLLAAVSVDAKPVSATIHAPTDGADAVFTRDIFVDEFTAIETYYIHNDETGPDPFADGSLRIDAGHSGTHYKALGKNYVRTRELYYERDRQYGDHPVYTIKTRFVPMDDCFRTFRIIDNDDVIIYISNPYGGAIKLYAYDLDTGNYLCDLNQYQPYTIYVEAGLDGYTVYVDTNINENVYEVEEDIDYQPFDREMNVFFFGDLGGPPPEELPEDWGYAIWKYFQFKGHTTSDV